MASNSDTKDLSRGTQRQLLEKLLREKARHQYKTHPLSMGQTSLFLDHLEHPKSHGYNLTFSFKIHTPVDTIILGKSFQILVDRHEILRTSYGIENDMGIQKVQGHHSMTLDRKDVRGWEEPRIQNLIQTDARYPFDLFKGPVIRICLYTAKESCHYLLAVVHHIAGDARSLFHLMDELVNTYGSLCRDRSPAAFKMPEAQYLDFVLWEKEMLSGPRGKELEDFWDRELKGSLPILDLPVSAAPEKNNLDQDGTHCLHCSRALDTDIDQQIKDLARQTGTSDYTIMFSAFILLLHHYSGQEEVLAGMPTSTLLSLTGSKSWDKTMGYMVNPVVIRSRVHQIYKKSHTLPLYLKEIDHTITRALDHQAYPYYRVQKRYAHQLDGVRGHRTTGLFNVMFNFIGFSGNSELEPLTAPVCNGKQVTTQGLTLSPFPIPQQEGVFDLVLTLMRADNTLYASLDVNPKKFSRQAAGQILKDYQSLLSAMAAQPMAELSGLTQCCRAFDLPMELGKKDDAQPQVSTAPDTDTGQAQDRLAKIWADVLELSRMPGPHEDFFGLGGHSLKVIRLASRINKAFNTTVPIKDLFKITNLADQARAIESMGHPLTDPSMSKNIPKAGPGDIFPLSNTQKRLWVLEQINRGHSAYIIPACFRFKGPLDYQAFNQSIHQVVLRHEALRTVFIQDKDLPCQKIIDTPHFDYEIIDLRRKNPGDKDCGTDLEKQAIELTQQASIKAFNLKTGPLLRVLIITYGQDNHLVLFGMHHIISDGWSLGLMVKELCQAYKGFTPAKGEADPNLPEPLVPLKFQYKDFALWQTRELASDRMEKAKQYFKKMFRGEIPLLNLPTDYPRPRVQSFGGRTHTFELSQELSQGIRDHCQTNQVSLFMFFSALVKVLLYKYSGQEDMVLGSPVAGRERHDLENQIGLYMNTLALRAKISPDQGFAHLLDQDKETIIRALEFQAYPFDRLVEEIEVVRRPDRSPLFDVMVLFQEDNPFALSLEGLDITPCPLEISTAKFDLLFGFTQNNCIQAEIEYNTALFSSQRISGMQNHLRGLCRQVLDNPFLPLNQLELITPEEKQNIVRYNNTQIPFPDSKTLVDIFEQTAKDQPHTIAVLSNGQEWTYDQINCQANALAHFLIENFHIQPDTCIGLMLKRSEKMISGILGILKSGAAYVPMDPDHPKSRNAYILKDSGCPLVLTDRVDRTDGANGTDEYPTGNEESPQMVDITGIHQGNTQNPARRPRPDSLAYVIYTSGSTGNPKGVMIEHGSVINRIQWMQNTYPLDKTDRIIQKTPFTFDVSVWELFWWSWTGAAVVMAAPGEEKDPARLIETICDHRVSVLHFVPSMFTLFLDWVEQNKLQNKLDSLDHIFTSGEALFPAQVDQFNDLFTKQANPIRLHNLYGPTEATVDVTYFECTGFKGQTIPIGKPIDNTQIYILDSHGNPLPPGVDGEICIGGVNLARGYINNPGLTAEKFIQKPVTIGSYSKEKIYKTGDKGRMDWDGNICYSGRFDFQVKIRGNRVEPGEIETCLLTHDRVKEAAVMAKGKGEHRHLAAYVRLSESGDAVSTSALKTFVQETLPVYMVPDLVMILSAFPLNPSGKTDRKALVAISPNFLTPSLQPLNRVETMVKTIWATLLGHDRISPQDNFFDIGGNSLLLVRCHTALEEQFPGKLTIADLFIHTTMAAIAQALSGSQYTEKTGQISGQILEEEKSKNAPPTHLKDIAVIGMGIRLADYDDLKSFEKDLFDCRDRVGQLSSHRQKDVDNLLKFSGQTPDQVKFLEMAFLDRIDLFDCKAFKISPNEAKIMAPEQRIFIETAAKALAHAGYGKDNDPKSTGSNVGVFVGASNGTSCDRLYVDTALKAFPEKTEQIFMGNVPSNMAGRLSFIMDWQGPAYMIDTACSSSLAAIHSACRSLRQQECEMALAGAAKINLLPLDQADLEIQSKDFRTRAFDNDANGTGGGEGVFAVLLKPLEKAVKDKDSIHAVIKGSALNQDGHCAGLTIPNEKAQSKLLRDAWTDAGIHPETLGFIEAHGTGTRLGDTIEVQGITRAFEAFTPKKGFCALGSVKTNIGHLDNAAGLAGFIKSVLCLKRKAFPGLVHFKTPNEKIPFDQSPVFPAAKTIDLKANRDNDPKSESAPLRCGVSSFGLSGINCHLVLEEAPRGMPDNRSAPLNLAPHRHWLELPKLPATAIGLAGTGNKQVFQPCLVAEIPGQHVYGFTITRGKGWVLNDHLVNGQPTLPGTAYFQLLKETAACHGMETACFSNLIFKQLFTPCLDQIRSGSCSPTLVIEKKEGNSRVQVMAKLDDTWQTYLSATLSPSKNPNVSPLNIQGIKERLDKRDGTDIREALAQPGEIKTSPRWHCLKEIWGTGNEILGRLSLAQEFLPDLDDFFIHPALVDAGVSLGLDTPGFVPMGCKKAWFHAPIPGEIYSHIRLGTPGTGNSLLADILLTDTKGNPLAGFEGFLFKKLSPQAQDTKIQTRVWQKIYLQDSGNPPAAHPSATTDIVILDGQDLFPDFTTKAIPQEQKELTALVDDIISSDIQRLVFAPAALFKFPSLSPNLLDKRLKHTLMPLFRLVKALATISIPREIQLLVLGQNTHEISQDDPRLIPENAVLEGFSRVIPQEIPRLSCRFLDFSLSLDSTDIVTAFSAFDRPDIHTFGLRDGQWTAPVLTTLDTGLKNDDGTGTIKENSVCLITGGMGGMGMALAQSMARVPGICLVLLGRSSLPSKSQWQDLQEAPGTEALASLISCIQGLEAQGAKVMCLSADVSNMAAMKTALETIRKKFGKISGVVHAAGLAGDGFIFRKDRETLSQVMAPKVRGSFILDLLTRKDNLDFFLLCSSMTALTGAPGQSDYTAANAFMDALSFARRRRGLPCIAINWPLWQEIGMAADNPLTADQPGLSGPQGAEIFRTLLSIDAAQAVVTLPAPITPPIQAQPDSPPGHLPKNQEDLTPLVIRVWCDVLGHDQILGEEDFFDLGGDSITAMEINHILTEALGMDLTIDLVFEHSVLKDFVAAIKALAEQPTQGQTRTSGITPAPEQATYPVSPSQKRLFFLHDLVGDATGYNLPLAFFLKKEPNPQGVENAFKALIHRHEPLRTSYKIEGENLVQIIQEDWEFNLNQVKLEPWELAPRIKGFSRPFKLDQAPLIRAELVCVTNGQWLLLFDVHHIAADGMALDTILRDFLAFYDNQKLPPVPLSYRDYTHWLNQQTDTRAFDRARDYYLDRFKGDLPVLAMPTDFPRPAQMTFEGDTIHFVVEEHLFAKIKEMAVKAGTTPFTIFLAAFYILFHKHTDQEDITLLVADNGRDRPELAQMVGMFVNTLAMRAFPEKEKNISDFILQVKEMVMAGFANKAFSFDDLVRDLNLPRDLSRSPLSDISFSYMNYYKDNLPHSSLEPLPYQEWIKNSSKFDMAIFATEYDHSVGIGLEYYSAIFKKQTMERLGQRFLTLLENMAKGFLDPISKISCLPRDETALILDQFSGSPRPYPKEKSLGSIFWDQVKSAPGNRAMICHKYSLTYQALSNRSCDIAQVLVANHQVQPGEFIGVMMGDSPFLAQAVLGILGAGCAYMPIDPSFPDARIRHMLSDTGCRVCVTDTALAQGLKNRFQDLTIVDAQTLPESGHAYGDLPGIKGSGQDTAYVIYTSGTTGQPKGTLICHQSVSRLVMNTNYIDIRPEDRILKTATIAFDPSVFELFGALLNGAGYCVPQEKTILDINGLKQCIRNWSVSICQFTTSLFNTLVEVDIDTDKTLFKGLRYVQIGGEKISSAMAAQFISIYPEIELINAYGPTENATITTAHRVTTAHGAIPIGKPISNSWVYILDNDMAPVPIGVTGIIYTGGHGVAKGYLNQWHLTAQVFIDSPFKPGDRLYNTGDLGYWDHGGNIHYLGRKDSQVKIRGFHIEPQEVENCLISHKKIGNAVVISGPLGKGKETILAGYYTAGIPLDTPHETPLDSKEIKYFLSKRLPAYMVPAFLTQIKTIPLTLNGKVDLDKLPLPGKPMEPAHGKAPKQESTALTQTQSEVHKIWSSILELEIIGVDDEFFDLGGHSLKATRVVSQVNSLFPIQFSVKKLFEYPVFRDFCQEIDRALPQGNRGILSIPPMPPKGAYPLSFAQERLWFLDRLIIDNPFYNIPFVLKITGSLNLAVLEQAINAILLRHESLRTFFKNKNGVPEQQIAPYVPMVLKPIELDPQKPEEIQKILDREAARVFDLSSPPLVQVKILNAGPDTHILSWTIHHIVADGWSMGILTQELGTLYQAFSQNQNNPLPPLGIQYRDFSQWQRSDNWLTILGTQKTYWLNQLQGFETLALPTDRPRPKIPTFTGDHASIEISPGLTAMIHARAKENGSSVFMILMGVFALLLSRYSGQEDVVTGTAIANRNKKEIEPLIGFFVNTLVLRFDLSEAVMVDTYLDQVRATILDAYANQDFPFEKLVEALVPKRDIGGYPITQVNLTFQNMSLAMPDLPGLAIEALNPAEHWVRFDLEVGFWEAGDKILGNFSYSTELFDRQTIEQMSGHFMGLLISMMETPKAKLADLSMLTPAEKSALHDLALTPYPSEMSSPDPIKPIWRQVRKQAQATPQALALMDEQGQITYDDLVRETDLLSARLVAQGAGPGTMVGMCLPRTREAIITLLAIFKAGAVYLPIDPAYPTERITYYIKDANIQLLVTRSELVGQGLFQDQDLTFIFPGEGNPVGHLTESKTQNPTGPAYVIYTSGSTGNPKGIIVNADTFARHIQTAANTFGITKEDRVLQFASLSFDVSLEQIFVALTQGAALVMRGDTIWSMEETWKQMDQHQVSVANFTPAYFLELMKTRENQDAPPWSQVPDSLRLLISGGEAMPPEIIRLWQTCLGDGVSLINAYGPTETTITALIHEIDPALSFGSFVPLGRPLPGRRAYVMDKHLNLVPKGIPGELILGGDGIASGFLDRPELTRDKFIVSPFAGDQDRMYRTGDLVQWGRDGNLLFLGRTDNQIKVRGFRMAPEEIERCLTDHPLVSQAAVAVKQDADNKKQLVGYLVPDLNAAQDRGKKAEQNQAILDWHKTIHNHYTDTDLADITFNISGWNSSYTGQAIPTLQMQAWVEQTIDRITALSPSHVLEIGCGTGLILARIAMNSKSYTGIDFSRTALSFTQKMVEQTPGLDHVSLMEKEALDLEGLPRNSFDTVILNSVAQYFPDMEYLFEVIKKAMALLSPGGALFMGDIKNLNLQKEFYFSVESFKQGKNAPLKEIFKGVTHSLANEEELFVDPQFFYALEKMGLGIGHVAVEPKPGGYINELSCFRYDVRLIKQRRFPAPLYLEGPANCLTDLKKIIAKHRGQSIQVPAIANVRNYGDCQAWHLADTLGDNGFLADIHPAMETGIDPGEIIELSRSLGLNPEFHIQGKCHFDLVLRPETEQLLPCTGDGNSTLGTGSLEGFTNLPAMGLFMKNLVPKVRDHALACLPGYMVPQFLVVLDALPVLPGGKIDRNALPDPQSRTLGSENAYVEPITDREKQLAAIWQDMLGIPKIGIHDDFFRLGGQSLLAVSLISRINTEMETDLALSALFQNSTIQALAGVMEKESQPWSPLVTTRAQGNLPPLFCFSPTGGNIYAYGDLAEELNRDIPFYVFQAKGLEKGQTPLASIEEMAAYNIDWIHSVSPDGPFYLSGWSLGGLVAFETARQLRNQGHEIKFLALFDSSGKKDKTTKELDMSDNAAFMTALFSDFFTIPMAQMQTLSLEEQADLVLKEVKKRGLASRDMTRNQLLRLLNVYKNNGLAAQNYFPGPYDGRIHLFKPEEYSPTAFQYTKTETQGWEGVTDDIIVHGVPGAHETMLKPPHVKILGAILNRLLLDVE